ncbi:MAG: AAA family ATPase, partial [Firmicutes bacterium]|nr:AAA family ATPase [Bacillota bacterium]
MKSIELTGFRGFCGPSRSLDTDGDIVLITGPNGYGKTSLIDALCLLLTGHLYRERYPLVSTINNVQQAILKAKVITDTEPNSLTEIAATVDRTNKMKWEAGPWEHKAPND